ncbi:MAG: hypothetical protein EZS28_011834 [Streblomastix strix]|uniref:Reverse transcriptase domain-containing protein n=1 Tax=Streblomastix strix TaxID=222440 RepID=A0A5J4WCL9_9EUKA|nr:MAG: hypothetical protein EZS28_011834 [Streblomastix strix]
MLMQVWRHQQDEQIPETPPQRIQSPVQQQQLGGKLVRYIKAWEIINCKDFITKVFYQILKDNNIQERPQQTIGQCPFQGNLTKMQAYKAMLQEELQEGKIEDIPKEQDKWWNPTFLILKSLGQWRKIFDASLLNEIIQPIHFQMNDVQIVLYLLMSNDWAVTFDLKLAFHHLIVCPPHRAYSEFEADNHYQENITMPFGIQQSPKFLTHALTLFCWRFAREQTSEQLTTPTIYFFQIKIKNINIYMQHIVNTLEQFNWLIALKKCQLTPKQKIDFLGWTWNMTEMNIFMNINW